MRFSNASFTVSSGSGPASSSSAGTLSASLIAAEVLPPWLECASSMTILPQLRGEALSSIFRNRHGILSRIARYPQHWLLFRVVLDTSVSGQKCLAENTIDRLRWCRLALALGPVGPGGGLGSTTAAPVVCGFAPGISQQSPDRVPGLHGSAISREPCPERKELDADER